VQPPQQLPHAHAQQPKPPAAAPQKPGFFIRPQLPRSKQLQQPAAGAAPAYVRVEEPKQAAAPAASPAGGGQKAWPPALRAYVERAFARATEAGSRAQLQVPPH
jgi:hypothetical protein